MRTGSLRARQGQHLQSAPRGPPDRPSPNGSGDDDANDAIVICDYTRGTRSLLLPAIPVNRSALGDPADDHQLGMPRQRERPPLEILCVEYFVRQSGTPHLTCRLAVSCSPYSGMFQSRFLLCTGAWREQVLGIPNPASRCLLVTRSGTRPEVDKSVVEAMV